MVSYIWHYLELRMCLDCVLFPERNDGKTDNIVYTEVILRSQHDMITHVPSNPAVSL